MMKDFQKMGGVAALIHAATYVVSAALMFTLMAPGFAEDVELVQKAAFFTDNQTIMY